METRNINLKSDTLSPELIEKLNRFCEIERWHRAFLTASPDQNDSIQSRCWDAAFREVPLTAEETRLYRELYMESH